jgi:hypothetical protein
MALNPTPPHKDPAANHPATNPAVPQPNTPPKAGQVSVGSPGAKAHHQEYAEKQKKAREELVASRHATPRPKDFKPFSVAEGSGKIAFLTSPEVAPMGAYDQFIGELWPGAFGWLPLDPVTGEPSGQATLEPPEDPDIPVCHVFANLMPNLNADLLVSASGAPLVAPLNPHPDPRIHPRAEPTEAPLGGPVAGETPAQRAAREAAAKAAAEHNQARRP